MLNAFSPSDLWTQSMSPTTSSALLEGLRPRTSLPLLSSFNTELNSSSPLSAYTPSPCPSGRPLGQHAGKDRDTIAMSTHQLSSNSQRPSELGPGLTHRPSAVNSAALQESEPQQAPGIQHSSTGKEGNRQAKSDARPLGAQSQFHHQGESAAAVGDSAAGEQDNREDERDNSGVDDEDEEEDGSSPIDSPDADEDEEEEDDEDDDDDEDEDEEESPFKFLENLDPSLFATSLDALLPPSAPAGPGRSSSASDTSSAQAQQSSAPGDPEFYGNMIQVLTHLLGSSDHGLWQGNAQTPASMIGTSPVPFHYSSPATHPTPTAAASAASRNYFSSTEGRASEARRATGQARMNQYPRFPDLQPLISALISRLGGNHHSPRQPVGEQDLTDLLHSLMVQQQRLQEAQQQPQSASTQPSQELYRMTEPHSNPSIEDARQAESYMPTLDEHATRAPLGDGRRADAGARQVSDGPVLGFADLVFEDEDEDDPDFNPDLNPDLPMPSAWSLAVQDVVGTEASRAAAFAAASTGLVSSATANETYPPFTGHHTPAESADRGRDGAKHHAAFAVPAAGTGVAGTEPTPDPFSRRGSAQQALPNHGETGHRTLVHREAPSTSSPGPPGSSVRPGLPFPGAARESAPAGEPELSGDEHGTEPVTGRKRGRKATLSEEEKRRRRLERNAEYARAKRRRLREEREAEQNATKTSVAPTVSNEEALELRVENKVLRAEVERLREENARLRAIREVWEMEQERSRPSSSRPLLRDDRAWVQPSWRGDSGGGSRRGVHTSKHEPVRNRTRASPDHDSGDRFGGYEGPYDVSLGSEEEDGGGSLYDAPRSTSLRRTRARREEHSPNASDFDEHGSGHLRMNRSHRLDRNDRGQREADERRYVRRHHWDADNATGPEPRHRGSRPHRLTRHETSADSSWDSTEGPVPLVGPGRTAIPHGTIETSLRIGADEYERGARRDAFSNRTRG